MCQKIEHQFTLTPSFPIKMNNSCLMFNDSVTKRLPEGHLYCRKAILDKHGFLNYNATHGKSLYTYLYWSL